MADVSIPQQTTNSSSEEITISELLIKLWAKRGLIFFLPIIFMGLTLVGLLAGKTTQQENISFYIELNGMTLSESNEKTDDAASLISRYPNGTVFSPQDLINPAVLTLLAKDTDLLTRDLARHIDVRFGTPVSNGVLNEYYVALSENSKASAQDIAALNARYERKINAAAKRGLKITVEFLKLGISKQEAIQLAEKLPRLWNTVYTEQFETQIPPAIASLRWSNDLHDLSAAIGLQEADTQLVNLKAGATLLSQDDRFASVRTESGFGASDLAGYIDQFRSIFFNPLFLGAFSKQTPLSASYARDVELSLIEREKEIAELENRLSDVRLFRSGASSISNPSEREATRLDGSALNEIIKLGEQATLSNYLEKTLDQRFALVKERASLETRLAVLMPKKQEQPGTISDDFLATAQSRYLNIVTTYHELFNKSLQIASDTTQDYFSMVTEPDTEGSLINVRDLLYLALATAIGGMLAIIVALVWPERAS